MKLKRGAVAVSCSSHEHNHLANFVASVLFHGLTDPVLPAQLHGTWSLVTSSIGAKGPA